MTTSIGPATDYLVEQATTAVEGFTVNGGDPFLVWDGQPWEMTNGMFVIGLSSFVPPDVTGDVDGTRSWKSLGAKQLQEDYTIPCYIDARVAGTSQKAARDLAEGVFNAFWALIAADLTLGGALGSMWAEIDDLTETPRSLGSVEEPARATRISFGVRCRNRTH